MAVSIALVPLYTRYFGVAEYGAIENLSILGVLLAVVFGLALSQGITRFYPVAESAAERARLVTTATVATAVLGLVAIAAVTALAGRLGPALLPDVAARGSRLLLLVTASVALSLQLALCQSVLLVTFRRREYLVTSVGSVLVSLAVTVVGLVGFDLGLESVFIGPVVGHGLLAVYAFAQVRADLRPASWDLPTLRRLLAFSLPLAPAALALFVIRSSDRYFITALVPDALHQVGLYSTAEKVMGLLTLCGAAFSIAWSPFAMAASRQPDAAALYRRAFRTYVALMSVGAVAMCAMAPLILRLLATPAYYPSVVFTPPLGIYLGLNTLYYIGSVGLVLTNRTARLVPMLLVAAVLNIGLNAVWIPAWGVSGAAWATVAAFLAYNAMIYVAAERIYPVGYPLGTALGVYVCAAVAASLAVRGPLLALTMPLAQLGVVVAVRFLEIGQLRDRASRLLDARRGRARR